MIVEETKTITTSKIKYLFRKMFEEQESKLKMSIPQQKLQTRELINCQGI